MTQEDVIRLAREADLGFLLGDNWMLHHELQAFAKLIAEHEREACALICENYGDEAFVDGRINADHHAYLIRQRGQA